MLAVGGHLKNTVALALGRVRETHHEERTVGIARPVGCVHKRTHPTQVVISAHVGDLDNVLSVEVFRRAIDDLVGFFQVAPDVVVCDLHPDYASTQHAQRLSAAVGRAAGARPASPCPRGGVHGGARIAGARLGVLVGRHRLWPRRNRLGRRGAVVPRRGVPARGAPPHVRPARRRRARCASRGARPWACCSRCWARGPRNMRPSGSRPTNSSTLLSMLARRVHSPRTSSMGRLFDAVAALCGLPPVISFEGQAAMSLEYAADEDEQESYRCSLWSLVVCECCGTAVPAVNVEHGTAESGRMPQRDRPRLGAVGARRVGRPGRRRARAADQRPFPQRPGRHGGGGCPVTWGGSCTAARPTLHHHGDNRPNVADRAQRRLFSERAVDRAGPLPAVRGRLFGVYSS